MNDENRYQERSISAQTVTLNLPGESIRRLKGLDQYRERGANPDPLGNREKWKQDLAFVCTKLIAAKLGAGSGFTVTPDGDIQG